MKLHTIFATTLILTASYSNAETTSFSLRTPTCEFPDPVLCARIAALETEQARVQELKNEAYRLGHVKSQDGIDTNFYTFFSIPSAQIIDDLFSKGYVMVRVEGCYVFCSPSVVEHKSLLYDLCMEGKKFVESGMVQTTK